MTVGTLYDNESGRVIELGETLMIGRRDSCQLQIKETKVSRQHAMVRRQGGGYWLYDLGSSNGSYVNEQRVVAAEKLADGDVVRIGGHRFTFRAGAGAGKPTTNEPESVTLDATLLDIRTVPVLMLVSDIRGFTDISEKISTDVLARAMSAWYRECKRVLGACGATLDKFIGDAVLAYWLDISEVSRRQALVAARRLQGCGEKIFEGQKELYDAVGAHLQIGSGIHLGEVAHGKMGRDTFTLIGGALNATFGLEALTRTLGSEVLVSDAFLAGWEEGKRYCKSLGSHVVKGRSLAMEVFAVESWPELDHPKK